jgi:hypothetical protein
MVLGGGHCVEVEVQVGGHDSADVLVVVWHDVVRVLGRPICVGIVDHLLILHDGSGGLWVAHVDVDLVCVVGWVLKVVGVGRGGGVIRKRREEGRSLYLVFDRNLLRQREKAERGT